jgi:transposase-like protein
MSAVPMAENRSMADRGTGGRTRRRWSVARKAALLAELGEPGATLSVVARWHAIAPSLLHRWRSDATDERRPALPRFAEVIADVVAPRDAAIEIEAPGLRVRVPVATRAETLVAILGVLRGHR